ncbi:GtrA family protein [uncultured Desulfobacter sp.]|uniref:GtrA family protein n=1 Tax=uncultured Desulfobacter sp. TaxID=240139 RepID=UPI0037479B1C
MLSCIGTRLFQFKLFRYGLVGLFCTSIHILVASAFIRFIRPSLFLSNLVGFFIAFHVSYYAQSKWVFQSRVSFLKSLKYLLVQVASLMVAICISSALTPFDIYLKVMCTAFVLPLITFMVHKIWTFNDQDA